MDMEVELPVVGEDVVYRVTAEDFEPNVSVTLIYEVRANHERAVPWASFVWHWQMANGHRTYGEAERDIELRVYDALVRRYNEGVRDEADG